MNASLPQGKRAACQEHLLSEARQKRQREVIGGAAAAGDLRGFHNHCRHGRETGLRPASRADGNGSLLGFCG